MNDTPLRSLLDVERIVDAQNQVLVVIAGGLVGYRGVALEQIPDAQQLSALHRYGVACAVDLRAVEAEFASAPHTLVVVAT